MLLDVITNEMTVLFNTEKENINLSNWFISKMMAFHSELDKNETENGI